MTAAEQQAKRACPVCHQSGCGPGDDTIRCWLCDGYGTVLKGVPDERGMFVDWLLALASKRASLQAEVTTLRKALESLCSPRCLQSRDTMREVARSALAAVSSLPGPEQT